MSEPESVPAPSPRHAGMVALVGRANVGKSSLTNVMLGEKLSIVSPVAQTTRSIIRGIITEPRGQLVLVDTPGLHKAPGELGKVMNRMARSSVEGVDAVLLVVEVSRAPQEEDEGWMRRLVREEVPVIIALNKVDLGKTHEHAYRDLWAKVAAEAGSNATPRWHEVSAETGIGIPELLGDLFSRLPEGPLLYPEDLLSDYPRKLNMADVIREKLFRELRQELPHAIAVWVENLDDTKPEWTARVIIYVNKYSQKGIVIGEKGRVLRRVRRSSEAELASIYEHPIALDLWVKVEKDWSRNFWLLKKFGYVG
jgi:GTP-binding protein Era